MEQTVTDQAETLHQQLQSLEAFEGKFRDILGDEAASRRGDRESSLLEAGAFSNLIEQLSEESRELRIGIVGRVKAGKSSLLNALLFDGNTILPKAATPMTAALTILGYGEVYKAEVEFYSSQDIEKLQREHENYTKQLERLINDEMESLQERTRSKSSPRNQDNLPAQDGEQIILRARACKKAERRLKSNLSLVSAHEQFKKIHSSPFLTELPQKGSMMITATGMDELNAQLNKYVGAAGEYMPFTKSVRLQLPEEKLQGIVVVDTPGVNDPVASREERTYEELNNCDVVLIVSPAGQFMTNEDTNLMDRITTRDGVGALYVVASQVDTQLFGSEKENTVEQTLERIDQKLTGEMHKTIQKLKASYPEVGNIYDPLLEDNALLHSSGVCHSLLRQADDKNAWDANMEHVSSNLSRFFPDGFGNSENTQHNLKLLANTEAQWQVLQTIREHKTQIKAESLRATITGQLKAMRGFASKLDEYLIQRTEEVQQGDLNELKQRQLRLAKEKSAIKEALDEVYQNQMSEFKYQLLRNMKQTLKTALRDTGEDIDNKKGTRKEEVEKNGAIGWIARKVGLGGYDTVTRETVKAGKVRRVLKAFIDNIGDDLEEQAYKTARDWKNMTRREVVDVLNVFIKEGKLDSNLVKSAVNTVFRAMESPEIGIDRKLPDDLHRSGTLTGWSAEEFVDAADEFLNGLQERLGGLIRIQVDKSIHELEAHSLSDRFTDRYEKEITMLREQVENREFSLMRLGDSLKALANLRVTWGKT